MSSIRKLTRMAKIEKIKIFDQSHNVLSFKLVDLETFCI